jgi:hypothetical protein
MIRTAVDDGSKDSLVLRHLSGCAECRTYDAESAALLALLQAPPRVQAPDDFTARLQARMAQVRADESVKLSYLLQTLPSLPAPADFDFRLRARLARAQSEPRGLRAALPAWLAGFWQQSFSLGRAATVMAAIALVAVFTTFQLTQTREPAGGTGDLALNSANRQTAPASANSAAPAKAEAVRFKAAARHNYRALNLAAVAREAVRAQPVSTSMALIDLPNDGQAQYGYGQQIARFVAVKAETTAPTF